MIGHAIRKVVTMMTNVCHRHACKNVIRCSDTDVCSAHSKPSRLRSLLCMGIHIQPGAVI
jgi:hypothetical protein